ncbi:MAG: cytidine deaminase [Sporichthyaceae bacterium]|nr:cytidine deaminase [Sporichthyaceae bacterium]
MSATPEADLPDEDAKLVALARAAKFRAGAVEGAAVRDDMGRTYVAATVDLPSLHLSAVQAAVVAAVSSGSTALEAVAVVSPAETLDDTDRAVLSDLSVTTLVLTGPDGLPRAGR